MAVEEQTDVAEPAPHTHVGKRARKHNGDAYVTGRVTYTEDVQIPGTVHAAVVRSPHAHARIRAIDGAAALERPDVLAVLTGAEAAELAEPIPHNLDPGGLGGNHADIRCLAVDKVVYVGQPVAAVVALTSADARAAAELVAVDYEPLPAVLDADAALAEGAPLLYEDWGSNVMISGTVGDGDFDAAAAGVEHVIDGRGQAAALDVRADGDAFVPRPVGRAGSEPDLVRHDAEPAPAALDPGASPRPVRAPDPRRRASARRRLRPQDARPPRGGARRRPRPQGRAPGALGRDARRVHARLGQGAGAPLRCRLRRRRSGAGLP